MLLSLQKSDRILLKVGDFGQAIAKEEWQGEDGVKTLYTLIIYQTNFVSTGWMLHRSRVVAMGSIGI